MVVVPAAERCLCRLTNRSYQRYRFSEQNLRRQKRSPLWPLSLALVRILMSIRIAVTGRNGQVARALAEAGPAFGVEVVSLGRPELDLAVAETVEPIIRAALPDTVVNEADFHTVHQSKPEPEQP